MSSLNEYKQYCNTILEKKTNNAGDIQILTEAYTNINKILHTNSIPLDSNTLDLLLKISARINDVNKEFRLL